MQAVGNDTRMYDMASDAFRSYVRSYATHSAELKALFHVRGPVLYKSSFKAIFLKAPGPFRPEILI